MGIDISGRTSAIGGVTHDPATRDRARRNLAVLGIGFAREEDWNTNLPYSSAAEDIYAHIKHNKGDDAIADEDCVEAIRLVQAAVAQDREAAGVTA